MCTYHCQCPWLHGPYVFHPSLKAFCLEPAYVLGKRALVVLLKARDPSFWLFALLVWRSQNLILGPKNWQTRACITPGTESSLKHVPFAYSVFFGFRAIFFPVVLKSAKWEWCLPKKKHNCFKKEWRGRGRNIIPFAGVSWRACPLRGRARARTASTNGTGRTTPRRSLQQPSIFPIKFQKC